MLKSEPTTFVKGTSVLTALDLGEAAMPPDIPAIEGVGIMIVPRADLTLGAVLQPAPHATLPLIRPYILDKKAVPVLIWAAEHAPWVKSAFPWTLKKSTKMGSARESWPSKNRP